MTRCVGARESWRVWLRLGERSEPWAEVLPSLEPRLPHRRDAVAAVETVASKLARPSVRDTLASKPVLDLVLLVSAASAWALEGPTGGGSSDAGGHAGAGAWAGAGAAILPNLAKVEFLRNGQAAPKQTELQLHLISPGLTLTTAMGWPRTRCSSVYSSYLNRPPNLNRSDNESPCECGQPCPPLPPSLLPPQPPPPALIISSSDACFERAAGEVRRGGFSRAQRVPPVFVEESRLVQSCCPHGRCGVGRRQKPSFLARMEGVVHAHRAAWSVVVSSGRPHAVFEDDVELLGTALDIRYALGRCETQSCGVAFLGVGMDYLLAHAYVLTPHAASLLLNATGEGLCHWNAKGEHGPDYKLRKLCLSGRPRVQTPWRLHMRGLPGRRTPRLCRSGRPDARCPWELAPSDALAER